MVALILKATENHNSNCLYCEVVRKEHMTLETLALVFKGISASDRQRLLNLQGATSAFSMNIDHSNIKN